MEGGPVVSGWEQVFGQDFTASDGLYFFGLCVIAWYALTWFIRGLVRAVSEGWKEGQR